MEACFECNQKNKCIKEIIYKEKNMYFKEKIKETELICYHLKLLIRKIIIKNLGLIAACKFFFKKKYFLIECNKQLIKSL